MLDAGFSLDLSYAYKLFAETRSVQNLTEAQKEDLFKTMCEGTKEYLKDYKL